jgi:hypothetical protein
MSFLHIKISTICHLGNLYIRQLVVWQFIVFTKFDIRSLDKFDFCKLARSELEIDFRTFSTFFIPPFLKFLQTDLTDRFYWTTSIKSLVDRRLPQLQLHFSGPASPSWQSPAKILAHGLTNITSIRGIKVNLDKHNNSVDCIRVCGRVARWFVFKPKIRNWVNFGGP